MGLAGDASADQINRMHRQLQSVATSKITTSINSIPSSWDVAVRFDVANFGQVYTFGQPLAVGEIRYANFDASDSTVEWIPY